MKIEIPIRFFIITFLWSWIIWLVVFLLLKIEIIAEEIVLPLCIIGAFGPAVGAFVSFRG